MSTLQYPMRRPWQIPCDVCGEVSAESYMGFNFCELHWELFRKLMSYSDWKVDPRFIVRKMKGEEENARRW
jgi:hypothetical protein